MPTVEQRIKTLEGQMRKAMATTSALQGFPSDATLSIPHNDSWLFEDNVDATHAANLRYVISANVQRVVSARLSIHLAAYRTYNTLTLSNTGNASVDHTHTGGTTTTESANHAHTWPIGSSNFGAANLKDAGAGVSTIDNTGPFTIGTTTEDTLHSHSGGTTSGQSQTHNHTVSGSSTLGVTEGAVATGVTVAFDGVDQTAALGGPFNADMIEIDVRRFIGLATGVWHVIAMQPSGLGRIEAHLRLGVYVSAGQFL